MENLQLDQNIPEPTSLVYKIYGGNIFNKEIDGLVQINSPLVQAMICYEQSRRGWGPKLYGLFEKGRIEEFIHCRTLKHEEAFIPEINKDIAKALARFHSLKLPIKQEIYYLDRATCSSWDEKREDIGLFLESSKEETDAVKNMKLLYDFPMHQEQTWLESVRSKIRQRKAFCTFDPNYLNKLVRNEKPCDPNATRVLLIDYDLSAYSHRGYDIGGHFVLRMFDWSGRGDKSNEKISGQPYPSESERMEFLSAYLEESEKLLDDFDKNSIDSLEQLTLEADFSVFVYLLSLLGFASKVHTLLDDQPQMPTLIRPAITLYNDLKKKFIKKYT